MNKNFRIIANNKKAYYNYFIYENYECGISLIGTEVKSLKSGKCSINESFARIINNEIFIFCMNIPPYQYGNIFNKDSTRNRKLLMHKSEIIKLASKCNEKGYTLIPLKVYINKNLIKVQIGLARGKKLYDKRDDIAKKDLLRRVERNYKIKFKI